MERVFSQIDKLIKENKASVLIAIDGNSGAGKSTLGKLIRSAYDCNVFHMDDFFLTAKIRTEDRLREVGGNVDYERFLKEVMDPLKTEEKFKYQTYNCVLEDMDQIIQVQPKRLNIVEGVYSMYPTLIDYYDFKIFLELDPSEQSQRILRRNGEFMHKKFIDLWIPLENKYFDKLNIKEKADLLIKI